MKAKIIGRLRQLPSEPLVVLNRDSMAQIEELPLSVAIIAYNEELNLARCLNSLPKGVELLVLDSHSTDKTADIARSFGARVEQRVFTNFAEQKNAVLALATRPWVLAIDADEELSPELRSRITNVVKTEVSVPGFYLTRRLVFMGRRMRYGKTQDQPLRLFKRELAHYEGSIHEEIKLQTGSPEQLSSGVLWHYSYRDLSDYFQRFNRYTSAIAERHAREGKRVGIWGHVFRPWFEFISRYFLRLGFLDGYPGYTYALISSLYAYVKYAKLRELKEHL